MKLQGAMEYLMTYGWAILIIAIVLAAIFSLGLLNSNNFSPKEQPGSCSVIRNSYGGATLSGTCNVGIPQFVAQFNGASSYITTANSPILNSNSLTITAWVYPANSAQTGAITGASQGGGPEFRVVSAPPFELELLKQSVTPIGYNTGNSLAANVWTFVAVTYSSTGNYIFYSNGAAGYSGNNQQYFSWSNTLIGSNQGTAEFFNGKIADVQIYNVTLSANSIQAIYIRGIGGAPINLQNLAGWWPLNGNTNDYSGNGFNGASANIVYVSNWYSGYTQP
jgi:hypothetical protein